MTSHLPAPPAPPARSPGRPREFDVDAMLDRVMPVFRERGYHGTSIADVRAIVGLATGSLYKAFKDKRALFLAVLDRYVAQRNAALGEALTRAPTGRTKLEAALLFYARSAQDEEGVRGCLVVGAAISVSTFDAELEERIRAAFRRNEAMLLALVREGQADRSIGLHVDAAAAAHFLLCVLQGVRVVGKLGATEAAMLATTALALRALD